MGNCQFYPNAGPSACMSNNSIDNENENKHVANTNSHQGHLIVNNNSAMGDNRNENESTNVASSTGAGRGAANNNNCNNGDDGSNTTNNRRNASPNDQQQTNSWNEALVPIQLHSHSNGTVDNAIHHTNGHNGANSDRIQNTYAQNATIATTPIPLLPPSQQSNALWNAFHNSRNPWHFNGIPSCYQRLYSENSNVTAAQTHSPYHHHHHHHHLQPHIEHNSMKSTPTFAQNSYQGLFYCLSMLMDFFFHLMFMLIEKRFLANIFSTRTCNGNVIYTVAFGTASQLTLASYYL